jgi:Family of unknown function (DUF6510)
MVSSAWAYRPSTSALSVSGQADHDSRGRKSLVDGNAVAGALSEIYGDDMTTVLAECAGCGEVDHVAGLVAYVHAPGIVLRCTSCSTVMLRIVQTPMGTHVDVRAKRMPPPP